MNRALENSLVAFDLDGTLARSKTNIDKKMTILLSKLLSKRKVVIASGASITQFKKQVIKRLPQNTNLSNLYILAENGASLYHFKKKKWSPIYHKALAVREKKRIFSALNSALKKTGFKRPKKIYGKLIEDRGSEVTFSALGSRAPIYLKEKWDPDHKKRQKIASILIGQLKNHNIGMAGTTSIDITRRGINKAFGLRYLIKKLKLRHDKIIYVGDALYRGGNDSVVFELKIQTKPVKTLSDTKKFINHLIK